jgi:thioredoxin 1
MKQITGAEFEAEVLKAPHPVLVDFFSEDCGPCRMMVPTLQEIETEANGSLKIVKIDVVAEPMLASQFRVTAMPTFLAFARGNCVGQTVGAKSKSSMKKWFEESVRST